MQTVKSSRLHSSPERIRRVSVPDRETVQARASICTVAADESGSVNRGDRR